MFAIAFSISSYASLFRVVRPVMPQRCWTNALRSLSHTKDVIVVEQQSNNHNVTSSSGFALNITIGKHSLVSDLKREENGIDLGPSPKELCLSALGSCTVMTIRTFYENSKKMALQTSSSSSWANSTLTNVRATVQEVSGSHPHVPVGLNLYIEIEGNLTNAQRLRLLKAAENCPVKKMMGGGLKIVVSGLNIRAVKILRME